MGIILENIESTQTNAKEAVQILSMTTKLEKNLPLYLVKLNESEEFFFKISWPSHKSWTLLVTSIGSNLSEKTALNMNFQWQLNSIRFVNSTWHLMSALATLESFGEKYLVFLKWRSCRHCLQIKWPLWFFFWPKTARPFVSSVPNYCYIS